MIMMQKIMIMVCSVTFHEKCSIPSKNSELSLLLLLHYQFLEHDTFFASNGNWQKLYWRLDGEQGARIFSEFSFDAKNVSCSTSTKDLLGDYHFTWKKYPFGENVS